MSFQRELAKAVLREIVSLKAEDASRSLRSSARSGRPGLVRDSKRALADVAEDVSNDPDRVVRLIESAWDGAATRRGRSRGGS